MFIELPESGTKMETWSRHCSLSKHKTFYFASFVLFI